MRLNGHVARVRGKPRIQHLSNSTIELYEKIKLIFAILDMAHDTVCGYEHVKLSLEHFSLPCSFFSVFLTFSSP